MMELGDYFNSLIWTPDGKVIDGERRTKRFSTLSEEHRDKNKARKSYKRKKMAKASRRKNRKGE